MSVAAQRESGSANQAAPPEAAAATVPTVGLRDYQSALLKDADQLFCKGNRAVLAYLPTGGGKTRIGAAAMAQWVLASAPPDQRCLFVVNRRTLLEQTREALVELGFDPASIGLIGGDGAAAAGAGANGHRIARVQVGMVQSLHERFREAHPMDAYALAIIDECHAAAAPSYRALLADLPAHARVLGLTATPFRSGANEDLSRVFDYGAQTDESQDAPPGLLS